MNITSVSCSRPYRALALALAGALTLSTYAGAADVAAPAAAAAKTEDCLAINRIEQTRIVDKRTVLFYYSPTEIYKNVLPRDCNGLQRDTTLKYKSSINQLCSVDVITPLVQTGGSYMPAGSCGLGKFERIDKAGVEKLLSDAKAARTNKKPAN